MENAETPRAGSDVRRLILFGVATLLLALTMGAKGGCDISGGATTSDRIVADDPETRALGVACAEADSGKGMRGTVIEGVRLTSPTQYCLQIRKSGYESEDPEDTRGWNALYPDCRPGKKKGKGKGKGSG